MSVVVYHKPGCSESTATLNFFNENRIPHVPINIDLDSDVQFDLDEAGRIHYPVVVVVNKGEQTIWEGFSPENIKTYIQEAYK